MVHDRVYPKNLNVLNSMSHEREEVAKEELSSCEHVLYNEQEERIS